jgi:hypothetical protein
MPWREDDSPIGGRVWDSCRPDCRLEEGAAGLFEDGRSKRAAEDAANDEELYEQIGRLKMEVEWLKKKAAELT